MKVLALEIDLPGFTEEDLSPYLKFESIRVVELFQAGIIREIYFTADHNAVIILECKDETEAKHAVDSLPLVKAGLITFELIQLLPYTGFSRLFQQ